MFGHLSAIRRLPPIVSGEGIPGYAELSLRAAWLGCPNAELSVVGQNLLHARRPESGAPQARGEIERSIQVAWGF